MTIGRDRLRNPVIPAICLLALAYSPAAAWDEDGHIIITRAAFVKLPESMPHWLRTAEVRARLEYLSTEPDRWRGQHNVHLDHINNPDHYIDEESLHPYGLSIKTLPLFRREFTDILATERALHPDKFASYDRSRDRSYTRLSPGLLPYRIAEVQWRIAGCWTTLKTYEKHPDLVTQDMIDNARQNIIYHMGILSHYVGDGSQPLHTTEHHHGWVGPNPKGYTQEHEFHQYIDGGIILHHGFTPESVAKKALPPRTISQEDYWKEIGAYLYETFEQVEPLYALEKSGELRSEAGKRFIENRLLSAGAMLSGVWSAAHEGARIDEFRENQLEEKKRSREQQKKKRIEKKAA